MEILTVLLIISVVIFLVLGFRGAPFWLWSLCLLTAAALMNIMMNAPRVVTGAVLLIAILGNIKPFRKILISRPILSFLKKSKFFPKISGTERMAIEAGSVWIERDLFSGNPDFQKLMKEPYPTLQTLNNEEKAFLNGPVQRLCAMINDWEIWKNRKLPEAVWEFIKKEKFLGMIIPKEYGGLGFSAMAHSEVIRIIGSRSLAATIYVMVPNSLGPAALLIEYGTAEQKRKLLPKLARGEEIPCFALTEPLAGSDAASITAEGILFRGGDGRLLLRLTWNKRWITLAAISTLIGLAFRLKDPENLLGRSPGSSPGSPDYNQDVGITCALIPTNTPGVVIGERHDPLGVPFYNCPTHGSDVIVSADTIVGGIANAGKGWKMLMECLAAGRGISLPAQSVGVVQLTTRVVSAHALIRQQFGVSIGRFEGVQDPLSKIAGYNYLLESLRCYTLSALDQGLKPSTITAIAKYYSTELTRLVINHGMDIMGGAGISLGPRNLLGHNYIAAPIAITVEGANILTRTLMIFGQGALRAHPYAYQEIKAVNAGDLNAFDLAFWGHIGHIVRNTTRSFLLSITRGWLAGSPRRGSVGVYYRKLKWISASFAIMTDIAMGSLGGKLKFKESITARFSDILAYMYMGTAVLRRFEADGAKPEHLPFVHFSMCFIMGKIQRAFDGIFGNLRVPGLTWFFRGPIRAWSNFNSLGGEDVTRESDTHVHRIATMILDKPELRDHLAKDIYYPVNPSEQLFRLERAVEALKKNLPEWEKIRMDAVQVDAFTEEDYLNHSQTPRTTHETPRQRVHLHRSG